MAHEMRQELNGVKAAVSALGAQMNAMQTTVKTLETDLSALKTDVGEVKTLARNTSIIVTGHTESLARIEQRLTKLDELDGVKKCLELITSETFA